MGWSMIGWLRFTVFAAFVIYIGVVDLRIQKIPNVLLFLLAGMLICIDIIFNLKEIPLRFLAAFGSFGLFYAVSRFKGGLGFGDVKYAGVIGYFLGPKLVIAGLLCAVILGMLFWAFGHLLFRWSKDKRLPFAPCLGCGALAVSLFHRGLL